MKKVFVFVALVLQTGGVINAQFQFTPHAGFAMLKEKDEPTVGVGAQIGVDVRYKVGRCSRGCIINSRWNI